MNSIEISIATSFATFQAGVSTATALAEKGQIEAALDTYRELRAAFPDQADGYLRAADLLTRQGQAERSLTLLRDGQARFADDVRFDISLGWLTLHTRDLQAASARWERVREKLANQPVGYVGGAMTLRKMQRLDDANALLETAVGLFPADPGVRIEHARIAHRSRDREEALCRWAAVRETFPDHAEGFSGAAPTLIELERLDEAETLLIEGVQKHPADRGTALELARVAHHRRNWEAAAGRWQDVRTKFPDWSVGFTSGAESLREAGRWQEAEALLLAAVERWPDDLGVMTANAWLALHRHDWNVAVERWTDIRNRFPDQRSGYLTGARALQSAGQAAEAQSVLADAQRRWLNDLTVLSATADLAHARRDYPDCIRVGKALVALFPNDSAGYFHASRAMREVGRHVEAEALLADIQTRFPDDAAILSIWASLAMGLQNWQEAITRWRMLQQRFPAEPKFFWQCANALTSSGKEAEAEALLKDATQRFPNDGQIAWMYAECLLRRGATSEADAAAAQIRRDFPDDPASFGLGVRARRVMGNDAGVAELLQEMLARFPNDQMALRLWAEDALDRHDWAAAVERWSRFREYFPNDATGFVGGALALLEGGWPDDSDALLAQGIKLLPHNARLLTEYAHNAMRQKDWNEAVLRWEQFRRYLPDSPVGYLGGAQALRDAGGLDRAETLLRSAVDLFPCAASLATEYANIARLRRDAPALIERSRLIAERFSDQVKGVVGYAEALSAAARHEEAEAILLDAQSRFPDRVEPFAEYAQVAMRQEAWAASLERWQSAQDRFPHIKFLSHRIFEARMRIAEVEPDMAASASAAKIVAASTVPAIAKHDAEDPDLKDIVKDFESLGGAGHGCEFGLFQRAYGAEPLGLLRWADLAPELLMDALEAQFDGVGLPENTVVFVPPSNGRAEYWTRDKRYWMAMRCFIPADEVSYEKMVAQACRRIQFLRRKLIDDLKAGEKIFVFKSLTRNLTDEELARLHRATRNYGDNTLLYVRYEDADNPNGSVRVAEPGLMIGSVDRFAFSRENKDLGPAIDRWAAVCIRAHAIWKAAGVAGTALRPGFSPGVVMPTATAVPLAAPTPAAAEPIEHFTSFGQRLVAGRCVDHPPFTLRWSAERVAELKRAIAEHAVNTREHAFASVLLDSVEGDRASARGRIGKLVDDFPNLYPHEDYMFEGLLLTSVISGQWDITPRLLRDRFGADWCAEVDVDDLHPSGQTIRWEIDNAGKSRFHFNQAMFTRDRTWIELFGWSRSMTLFHDYTTAPGAECGSVMVSLGDGGAAPGLASSENRPEYYLVPDPVFLSTDGYASTRTLFDAARVPWAERSPVAFWRGASTGQLRSEWRNLPRMKLCLVARQHAACGMRPDRRRHHQLRRLAARDGTRSRGGRFGRQLRRASRLHAIQVSNRYRWQYECLGGVVPKIANRQSRAEGPLAVRLSPVVL